MLKKSEATQAPYLSDINLSIHAADCVECGEHARAFRASLGSWLAWER